MDWKLVTKNVEDLVEWDKNPRKLVKEKLEHLKASITKFGVAEPLVVNTDNTICGGHGRKQALLELGIEQVQCYVPTEPLSAEDFAELNIRLNKNIAGEWDYTVLKEYFLGAELQNWGFDQVDVDLLYGLGAAADMPPVEVDVDMTEHRMEAYTNAIIKQIVLFYDNEKYEGMLNQLDAIGKDNGLDNNSDVVEFLVQEYMANNK